MPERLDLIKGTVIGHRDGLGSCVSKDKRRSLHPAGSDEIMHPGDVIRPR